MEPLAFVAGAFCIALVLLDVFETVVVPRPTPGRFRIARHLTALSWRGWRFMGRRLGNGLTRERNLGIYAPALVLETYAELGITSELPALFADWERWSAEVLDSHVAYPILGYFRSSHDNMSWVGSVGAVLDAATLVITTIRGVSRAQAELTRRVGGHLVEDVSNFVGLRHEGSGVTLADFAEAHRRLATAGYDLEPVEAAWSVFEQARATYSGRLEALAEYWVVPGARWVEEHAPTRSVVHELAAAAHHHDHAGRNGAEGAEAEAEGAPGPPR